MPETSSELIVSTHIPKNGGNTFVDFLNKIYGDSMLLDYDDMPLSLHYPLIHFFKSFRKPRLAPGVRCVHGHFLTGKYDHIPRSKRYVVWLRDPVERVLSHYYFWMRNPDRSNPTCRKFLKTDLSMEAFLSIYQMCDVQSRYMNGHKPEEFDFVGIVEDFNTGLALYRAVFGIEQDVEVASLNVNLDRKQPRYDVSDDIRQLIREFNPGDVVLYADGLRRHEELLRLYGLL